MQPDVGAHVTVLTEAAAHFTLGISDHGSQTGRVTCQPWKSINNAAGTEEKGCLHKPQQKDSNLAL